MIEYNEFLMKTKLNLQFSPFFRIWFKFGVQVKWAKYQERLSFLCYFGRLLNMYEMSNFGRSWRAYLYNLF